MTGNDVEYTYGTSGNETGRLVHIVDGSGSYECFYDALGNVTEDIRTIALPGNNDVYRFKTQYTYDSWGRMDQMIYPDGEVVSYKYIRHHYLSYNYNVCAWACSMYSRN